MPENPVPVCAVADLPPGSVKSFELGDEVVAVYNVDGSFYATEARCTHGFADLADGILEGDVARHVMDMCWSIEKAPDAGALAEAAQA